MKQILIFVALSGISYYFSRSAIRVRKSHGFYRFLAWECIALLFSLNMESWLIHPFAWYQIVSWVLLMISLIPLIFGVEALKKKGKPGNSRAHDGTLMAFEKTTRLVTTGIYRWIRHPLYSSLLYLTWGIYFKSPSVIGFIVAVASTAFLYATAKADEEECILYFGKEYANYIQTSRRFIPFLF